MTFISCHQARTKEVRLVISTRRSYFTQYMQRYAWPTCLQILAFWAAKFTKMEDSLLWTPTNRRAKFDAASFILGGEIHNHTHKRTKNSQTVNDISTSCLSACVDNISNAAVRKHVSELLVLFCSLAILDPRVGHTMDVLSPFISVLCNSD